MRPTLPCKGEKPKQRLTAQLLVPSKRLNPVDVEYKGDALLITNEMNVTLQVLKDYRELILDLGQYA